jgi:replication factor A1
LSEVEEFIVMNDLRPGLRGINIKVKCNSKNEEREVVSRKTGEPLRVTEALVGDETGCVLLTLWNEDIDKMEIDGMYKLGNVYTTVYRGSLRLNIGKYGNMEEIEEDGPSEIDLENNLSDKVYEQEPRYRSKYGGGGRSNYGRGGGGGRPYRGSRRSSGGGGYSRGSRKRY